MASASLVKFSLLLRLKVFSWICASLLSSRYWVSLSSKLSSNFWASSKACFLSSAVNWSSCLDFNLNKAISLSNFERSTIKPRSILSAFALISATAAAAFPSLTCSLANSLTALVASWTVSVMLSTPKTTLPTLSVAIFPASLKLPLNSCSTAFPRFGIKLSNPSNLVTILSFIKLAKSDIAFCGFSKALIIPSPKSASKSTKLPVKAPITDIILLNLFWPSSLPLNAAVKATIPIIKAPIPVDIIATRILLNPVTKPFTPPSIFLKPLTAPPVNLSNWPVIASVLAPVSFISLLTPSMLFSKSLTPLTAPLVSAFKIIVFSIAILSLV